MKNVGDFGRENPAFLGKIATSRVRFKVCGNSAGYSDQTAGWSPNPVNIQGLGGKLVQGGPLVVINGVITTIKWPYKWITGVYWSYFTPTNGVTYNPTSNGFLCPPCRQINHASMDPTWGIYQKINQKRHAKTPRRRTCHKNAVVIC